MKNGIKVILLERNTSPTISFYIRFKAGAANDPAGKSGMAHLLEHMLFKGTKSIGTVNYKREREVLKKIYKVGSAIDRERMKGELADKDKIVLLQRKLEKLNQRHRKLYRSNEIDRIYTENGAEHYNATTGQDLITVHVSLPSNRMEVWARIESDRMFNTVFREFYQERNVILEERKQRIESRPEGKLMEKFYAEAFTVHPYNRPIIGYQNEVAFITPHDLQNFYRETLSPEKTIITVVGNFKSWEAKKIIHKYFGNLKTSSVVEKSVILEPPQKSERKFCLNKIDAKPLLVIGYHKPNPPHDDDCVFDVISTILSRGRSSRFFQEIVEKRNLAESVIAINGLPGERYPNLFVIYAQPRSSTKIDDLENAIYSILEDLKNGKISQEELNKAKNYLRVDVLRSQTTNEEIADMLSYYEAQVGDFRYIERYLRRLDSITLEDLRRVAHAYLKRDNRTVGMIAQRN
ncbi:MAG: insulinase family protein [Syntrophales bacterium]|nr:insulinase family protein [Syntrophales bacterium]